VFKKLIPTGVAMLGLTMLVVACSSEEQSAPTATGTVAATSMPTNKATSTPTIAPIRKPTQAPSTPKLEVKAPLQGESVTSPVTVEVASTHLIAAPELNVPNAAHYHVFVDKSPFTPVGQIIPTDQEGIYHFSQSTLQLDVRLGHHTLVFVLGDNSHVRLPEPEAPSVVVDINVVESTPKQ
jgi:hypothetical protein